MDATRTRVFLGRHTGFGTRQRIFRAPDAIEIDETDHYQLTRRRLFFGDVLMVTYHQSRGWFYPIVTGSLGGVAALITLLMPVPWSGRLVAFAFTALPLLMAFGLRLALGMHTVTVFGRRTRARIDFPFRETRARAVFTTLCNDARRAQAGQAAVRAEP